MHRDLYVAADERAMKMKFALSVKRNYANYHDG